jgi:hypothetical protein
VLYNPGTAQECQKAEEQTAQDTWS